VILLRVAVAFPLLLGPLFSGSPMRVELGSGIVPATGKTVISAFHRTEGVEAAATIQSQANEAVKRMGNLFWDLLHNYRGCDPYILKVLEHLIPSGGCKCKDGYRKIMESFQWDFSTPEAFFESGVRLHNIVNEKLIGEGDTTKRIVSLEEAYSLWRKPDASDQNKQA
jgi:hypothetical protein